MKALPRWLGVAVLALCIAAPAAAQENIDAGKSPAQLYAQNCALCHKTPHGLTKAVGARGLQNFLREHYTASRESAAAIAGYLAAIDRGAPPRGRAVRREAKKEAAKAREEKAKKAGEAKPADAKPGAKPEDAQLAKPPEAKADAKPEAKADAKSDGKPAAADANTGSAKASSDAKPEKKTD
jgi:hypothetical protein